MTGQFPGLMEAGGKTRTVPITVPEPPGFPLFAVSVHSEAPSVSIHDPLRYVAGYGSVQEVYGPLGHDMLLCASAPNEMHRIVAKTNAADLFMLLPPGRILPKEIRTFDLGSRTVAQFSRMIEFHMRMAGCQEIKV
jgi:hypothetical protein